MRIGRMGRSKLKDLPIVALILICTNKWIFEGIFNSSFLELVFLLFALVFAIIYKKLRISKASLIWLLYCICLLGSLIYQRASFGVWGRGFIMITIVLFAVVYRAEDFSFSRCIRLLVYIGIFNAVLVYIHFFLRQRFNDMYFPLLPKDVQIVSNSYFKRGYFFGLLYAPHEVAGILAFSIASIVLTMVHQRRANLKLILLVLFMAVPMFLTGKRGVLLIFVGALMLSIFILFGTKRQWKRLFIALVVIVVAVTAVLFYILKNPDNTLFYRFTELISGLKAGEDVSTGRTRLYTYAIQEWSKNRLFGIGWGQFSGLMVSSFGYETGHQVNLDYLQWLCETGVVGFILILIPILVTVYQTIYVCRKALRKRGNRNTEWVLLVATFIQVFTLVYAFVEVPFYDVYFFAMYMLSCIVINCTYFKLRRASKAGLRLRYTVY